MQGMRVIEGGRNENIVENHDDIGQLRRRWAWVQIDTEAIRHNVLELRKRIGQDCLLMAVVKADGYGHGAVAVARTALAAGADKLAVATIDEGIELRRAGVNASILVLSEPPQTAIPLLIEHRLTPAVDTVGFALALGEAADAEGLSFPYHLKVDTGMNRVGVHYNDAVEFLQMISFHRGLSLEGVFTHFATADSSDDWEFKLQLKRFEQLLDDFKLARIDPGIVHAANSASIILHKKTHFDMVRAGIALYGLHPSPMTKNLINLRPAMEVHARIAYVKHVPVGEGVGYGFTYRSPGNVQIATIPLGYADGLCRHLSNNMGVLLQGRFCPQVGTISMDQTTFEINMRGSLLIPRIEAEVGDEVIIIGRDGDIEATLDSMADALGTINYELACRFGMRLARIYT